MISVKMRNMLLLQTGGNKNEMLSITFGISGMPVPIWRKVVLPAKLTFDDLHDVIQCLFQWEHQHLFEFTVGKYTISPDSSIPFPCWN